MKVMVFLAVVGVCVALPQGFLLDTPEVQAERERFFRLYNAAAAAAAAAPDDNVIFQQASHTPFHAGPQTTVWTGPFASTIPAGVDGPLTQVQDTPEVAAARKAFEAVFQQQLGATSPKQTQPIFFPSNQGVPVQPKWMGPLASEIPAGLPGSVLQVRNTPEVEAAIAEFTRAYNSAAHTTHPAVTKFAPVSNHFVSHGARQQHAAHQPQWRGPFASNVPAGLPGSKVVMDTADVSAARADFDRAFQQQLSAVFG